MEVTRAEMLFAKGVILVEGAAEEFLIPAFAVQQGYDLDAHGVTVCSVRGTDFLPYRRVLGRDGLNIPNVVITDGDPDADGDLEGAARGLALVGPTTRGAADDALPNDAVEDARRALRRGNVFVREVTLELDLISAGRDAMVEACAELEASTTKQHNFARDLDAFVPGDTTRARAILGRLGKIGKGRYAQRLAGHLDGVRPPEYIRLAIARILSKVRPDE